MSCKHKQAEPPPSHRKQDPVLFQIQEFQHIFKSLPNPRETPREKLYDLHPRTAWNYTRVCRTYTEDVSRFDVSSLWLISPYITNRSSRSSPLEISRGRKRERESEMGFPENFILLLPSPRGLALWRRLNWRQGHLPHSCHEPFLFPPSPSPAKQHRFLTFREII